MKLHRFVFVGLWILSLVAISFYGGTISYGFFFGLMLLAGCCLMHLIFVYFNFRLYQKLESRDMVCGQSVPYFFVLQNDSFFAFSGVSVKLFSSFSYVDNLVDGSEYELLPKDKYVFETQMVCKYRGEYEVGVKEIIATDFLRLFRIHYPVAETIKAIVLPRIVHLKELMSIQDVASILLRESLTAQTEPDIVIRDYVEGDPMKQIHWKATARMQKLEVRNLCGEEKQGIAMFCDTNRCSDDMHTYLPIENKILEIFLALSIFFAQKGILFDLYYTQSTLVHTQVNGMQDMEVFYQQTSSIMFRKEYNTTDSFMTAAMSGRFSKSKVVFAVLSELSADIFGAVDKIVETGTIVVIYLVTDDINDKYVEENSLRKRIIVISPQDELEGRL